MSARRFALAAIALLTVMGALEVTSMLRENNTADEAIHLMAGYAYLREAAFGFNAEHPPLGKILCAIPLLFLKPELPAGYRSWETREGELARRFLFANRVRPEVLLNSARSVTVALSLLLGIAIALWTRSRFGASAGLLALALYCFDPNFIAHGRYVTTDIIASLSFFLACIAWNAYLENPSRWRLLLAGMALGIALISKFSLIVLPAVFIGMYAARIRVIGVPRAAYGLAAAVLVAAAEIWLVYAGEVAVPINDPITRSYLDKTSAEMRADPAVPRSVLPLIDPAMPAGSAVQWLARHVPIPAFSYFKGLYRLYNHNYAGHSSYLLGMHSQFGWWFYFPVAVLVKSPLALLALFALSAAAWARGHRGLSLGVPALVYFAISMSSHINIGVRHILPVFPFLYAGIGAMFGCTRWLRRAAAILVPVLMVETLAAYPNYLAFFNIAAGGAQAGPLYLSDSNIDWGQDLRSLKAYLDRGSIQNVCLKYFGSGDPQYYKLSHQNLSSFPPPAGCTVAAVSVTELLSADARMRPFLYCEPLARVGYSIYVYDAQRCAASVRANLQLPAKPFTLVFPQHKSLLQLIAGDLAHSGI